MASKSGDMDLMEKFERYCQEKGVRFSRIRFLVFEIIAASQRPLGAYDIIDEMTKVTDKPKPPTVYRALEFLKHHGLVHKIESLNAFVACTADCPHEGAQFTVCHECGLVEEVHVHHLPGDLQRNIAASGFKMKHWGMEIHGVCRSCQAKNSPN